MDEFRDDIVALANLLTAISSIAPRRVDMSLVKYLEGLKDDPCGLEVLYNSLHKGPDKANQ